MNNYFKFLIFVIICHENVAEIDIKKGWTRPDMFGRKQSGDDIISSSASSNSCPACDKCETLGSPPTDDTSSSVFYRRLIASLFDRRKLEHDDYSGTYSRSVVLTLSANQLKMLEESMDPRDWDGVVSEVFSNARTLRGYSSDKDNCFSFVFLSNFHITFLEYLAMSEIRFTLLLILAGLLITYVHRKYNRGIIFIFIVGLFLFGYVYTYYDCNRQLEVDELAELLENNKNPCEEKSDLDSVWNLWNVFSRSSKDKCIEHLRKKNKLKLPYCRPDDVFLIYVNKILFNQFKQLTESSVEMFRVCSEEVPFPYNIIAMIGMPFLLFFVIKLFFQHILSPAAWSSFRHSQSRDPREFRRESIGHGRGDQISGENLKLLLETVKHGVKIANETIKSSTELPQFSGVEEVQTIKEQESPVKKDTSEEEFICEKSNVKNNEIVK